MDSPKIKDIAQMANVSPATVSIVLNNRRGVSKETRERIGELLKQHGYRVATNGERLKERGNIWFLQYKDHGSVIDGCESFFSDIINSTECESRKHGYKLSMVTMTSDDKDEIFGMFRRDPMDGIILLGTELQSSDVMQFLELGVPVVAVDNQFEYQNIDCVLMNNTEIVYNAVKHLYEAGHTKIGHLKSTIHTSNFTARGVGFKNALEAFSIEYNPGYDFELIPNSVHAYEGMKKYLERKVDLPTALFADSDTLAIGVIKAFKEAGVRIPEDISIIGFDDVPFAGMVEPPLTTMKINRQLIGKLSVERLINKICNEDKEVVKTFIGAELIQRASICTVDK